MSFGNNLSIVELGVILSRAPGGERAIKRFLAGTYSEFIDTLLEDIDDITNRMERNRQNFQKSSEDEITFYISSMLEMLGYEASNGTQSSGSVDLTVQRPSNGWRWTAEAKIYNSINNVEEGFLQLVTRYSPGDIENAQAGMLIYIRTKNAAAKMKEWQKHLLSCNHKDVSTSQSKTGSRQQLSFKSTHIHQSSGLPMHVRHMGIWLHFRPEDASGRSAKRYSSEPPDSPTARTRKGRNLSKVS